MKRYLCFLALVGILAVPDWASACWPWYRSYAPAPVCAAPPVCPYPVYPPAYGYSRGFPPQGYAAPPVIMEAVPGNAVPNVKVETAPKAVAPNSTSPAAAPKKTSTPDTPAVAPKKTSSPDTPAVAPKKTSSPDTPATATSPGTAGNESTTTKPKAPPQVDPVHTTGGTEKVEIPSTMPKKAEATMPKKADLPTLFPGPLSQPPTSPLKPSDLPSLELPNEKGTSPAKENRNDTPNKGIPTAVPGAAPADPFHAAPSSPSKNGGPSPPIPGISTPPALPSAAPASVEGLIPPPVLPLMPKGGKGELLPSLILPPETPVAPSGNPESTSHSSPVSGAGIEKMKVEVLPVMGMQKVREGYRAVTFYNYTNSEVSLSIEGRSVKLPAKNYVNTKLGPTFTWSYGDRPSMRQSVPDGAEGLGIVFRNDAG